MLFKGPSQWGDMAKFSLGQRMKASVTGKHPNAGSAPKGGTMYSDNMSEGTRLYHSQRGNTVLPTSHIAPQKSGSSTGTPPPPPGE